MTDGPLCRRPRGNASVRRLHPSSSADRVDDLTE
jgi:hypothetical protein